MTTPRTAGTRPAAAFRETFARELRRGARDLPRDVARGFLEDLGYAVAGLVAFVVLAGGGAWVGSAIGGRLAALVGLVLGVLVGGAALVVIGVVVLARTGRSRGAAG
ncbi:hypothetical protein [Cellulomonas persica]|uniref:Uncharacterized protein n=1 Tax=Cellulomonas persica TaxID=76861 RepID=A0A510USB9_9CELL|nr:hypothetical protein [Cellulomonas persica]GEK17489.1 hypothetical protein CPE01_12220 [Cellulomonas persica]